MRVGIRRLNITARRSDFNFNLEVTPESVRELVSNCAHELMAGKYVQAQATLAGSPAQFEVLHGLLFDLLDALAKNG